jgi:single-stranded-DNA-specific exonuclease
MAEEYSCPAFLICLDGDHGKASSRSFGGFNLFASLTALSPLLESYGGHELAAGFTIHRSQITAFRQEMCHRAAEYYAASEGPRTVLDVDCAVSPELFTVRGIDALQVLEPCGNGCPKPVLMMEKLTIDRISMVGSGRHMRLRLKQGHHYINAIYFSANPEAASVEPGDIVDVAFHPQVNEFRGERTVQMNVLDIRPSCTAECSVETAGYAQLRTGQIDAIHAAALCPDRKMLGIVWRYLAAVGRPIQESPMCLCRKIVRWTGMPMSLGQMLTCLDVFRDVGLIRSQRLHKYITIELTPGPDKADLNSSATMQLLLRAKES